MKLNWIPIEKVNEMKSDLEAKEVKLKQLKDDLSKKKDLIKRLQNEQDTNEWDRKFVEKDHNDREQLLKKYHGVEKELKQRKEIIKDLKEENKEVKLENSRLQTEVERLNTNISNKNEKIKLLEENIEELKDTVKYLQEKSEVADSLNRDLMQLEQAIQTKDEIIWRLKESLDHTIHKFNMSQSDGFFKSENKNAFTSETKSKIINEYFNPQIIEKFIE